MTTIFRLIPLAACVVALSTAGAAAQDNPGHAAGPDGATSATPTYPPGQGGNPALSPGSMPRGAGGVAAAQNPNVPGATGRTIIPGNNSTISRDTTGTVEEKTGQIESSGGGAGGGGGGGGGGGR